MFATLQLFVAAFALFVAHSAEAQVDNCARNYTVVLGDTCDGISAKENVSTYVRSVTPFFRTLTQRND